VSQSGATFSNIPSNPHSGATSAVRGLGDAISSITHALRIPECDGCGKRREWLNRMWHWSQTADPVQSYIILQQEKTQ